MSTSDVAVLLVEDNPRSLRAMTALLKGQGFRVFPAVDEDEALSHLESSTIEVALLDFHLPSGTAIDLMRRIRERDQAIQFIVFTAQGSDPVFDVFGAGAVEFFINGPDLDQVALFRTIRRSADRWKLLHDNLKLTSTLAANAVLGNSPSMYRVRDLIQRVARSRSTVLVTGETGSGKEVVARAIHEASGRKGAFFTYNSGGLDGDMAHSALFGHVPNAFNNAVARDGAFTLAAHGTLVLDELGEMPMDVQTKLLRVLEERKYEPLGWSGKPYDLTARVIAMTNRDLADEVAKGRFRQDLYFRLNVVTIPMPPLREHKEDIPALAYHFINELNAVEGKDIRQIPREVLRAFEAHDWPGNVRELRNEVERAYVMSVGTQLEFETLTQTLRKAWSSDRLHDRPSDPPGKMLDFDTEALLEMSYRDAVNAARRWFAVYYMRHQLARSGWNIRRTADASGMRRENFRKEMRRFGVEVPHDIRRTYWRADSDSDTPRPVSPTNVPRDYDDEDVDLDVDVEGDDPELGS